MKTRFNFLLICIVLFASGCAGSDDTASSGHDVPPGRNDSPALSRLFALRPFLGVAYKPAPSNYNGDGSGIYYDSDFCNDDFRELWGPSGRNDLAKLKAGGVSILHIYDWNQPGSGRSHRAFLDYCASLNICVVVPISKYYIEQVQANNPNLSTWFKNFVDEIYPGGKRLPSAVMWSLGNEFDNGNEQTPQGIARAAQLIIQAENAAGIAEADRIAFTSPVTYGIKFGNSVEGAGATLQIKNAFTALGLTDAWNNRYVAAVNSFNPGTDLGPWVATRFPQATNNIPFILFEMGKEIGTDVKNESDQGTFYSRQLSAVLPYSKNTQFLGPFVFSFVNEAWKGGTEATFGVYKIGTPNQSTGHTKSGAAYPIDGLLEKSSFGAMKTAYIAP